jgi:uncharacterized delta-60 repeat protein
MATLLPTATGSPASRQVRPRPSPHPRPTPPSNVAGVNEAWVARYSGPNNGQDQASAIAIDSSGNVYVTGSSFDGFTDYATVKYDAAGEQQWVARYDGAGHFYDYARAIAVDAAGNVYVTGYSSDSALIPRYTTIKYNSAGQEQWVAVYGGGGTTFGDSAAAIAVDASGNIYVTGTSEGVDGIFDYATIKYDSAGREQWVTRYNGPAHGGGGATAMLLDNSGNIYVTGTAANGNSGADYATIKYNSSGQEQWVAFYSGPGSPGNSDSAEAMALDASGNVYVTGESQGLGTDLDYATVKYNSDGQQQWAARYVGPSDHDEAHGIAVDNLGNVYVTGFSWAADTAADYATIKYNSAGQEQWVARYNGPANLADYANAIAVDSSGNVYVTGTVGSDTWYDYATIKYNSAGQQQWVAGYSGPGGDSDEANAIVVDGSGNIYVTGYSSASGFDFDYATIKYVQPTPAPTSTPIVTPRPRPTPHIHPTPH